MIGLAVNGASGLPEIAPGSWVSLYGRLATSRREWTEADIVYDWLPTTLDGVEVAIGDKLSVISFVSPGQVNVLAPDDLRPGPAEVTINGPLGWQKSSVLVKEYAPGLFLLGNGPPFVLAFHSDWSYVARFFLAPAGARSSPARAGETVVLYGTGFGPTNPPVSYRKRVTGPAPLAGAVPLKVEIGNAQAEVVYAGMVGNGLYQLNVVVPNLPDGDHEVVVTLGTDASPRGKLIPVQR